jgi:hypothetical protein
LQKKPTIAWPIGGGPVLQNVERETGGSTNWKKARYTLTYLMISCRKKYFI